MRIVVLLVSMKIRSEQNSIFRATPAISCKDMYSRKMKRAYLNAYKYIYKYIKQPWVQKNSQKQTPLSCTLRRLKKIFNLSLTEEIFVKWTIPPKKMEQDTVKLSFNRILGILFSFPQRVLDCGTQKPCMWKLSEVTFDHVFLHASIIGYHTFWGVCRTKLAFFWSALCSQLNTFKAGLDVKVTNVR